MVSNLKANLISNFLIQFWIALMGIGLVPIYVKILGVETYGLIGLFAVIGAWVSLLDMGMKPILSREMARFTGGGNSAEGVRDLLRSLEFFSFLLASVIIAGIFLSSDWLAKNWLKVETISVLSVSESISIMGVIMALGFVQGLYGSCLGGMQRHVQMNAMTAVIASLRGLGAIGVLMWISPTIKYFFLWQAFMALVSLMSFIYLTYKVLPRTRRSARFSIAEIVRVRKYGVGILGITVISLLLTQMDKLLLSKFLTLTDFGYYTIASLAAGSLSMLSSPIVATWFPRLSQLHASDNEIELIKAYHLGAQLITVIVGSAAIVLMVFPEVVLSLWTRDAVLVKETSYLFMVMILGNLLNALMMIPYQTQLAFGWTSLTVRINLIALPLVTIALYYFLPNFGAIGAAWIYVALNAGYLLFGVLFMYKKILRAEMKRWYLEDLLLPLLAGSFVVLTIKIFIPVVVSPLGQFGTLFFLTIITLLVTSQIAPEVRRKSSLIATKIFKIF